MDLPPTHGSGMIRRGGAARRGWSIRLRLLAMMMAVVAVAAVSGYGIFAYWQIELQRERLQAISRSLAEVLAQDFARLALLGDAYVAADIDAKLAAFPALRHALLRDIAGEPLYEYVSASPGEGEGEGEADGNVARFDLAVDHAGQKVGTLRLAFASEDFATLLGRDIRVLLQVGALSFLLAFLLAIRLESSFLAPLLRLVGFLEKIDPESCLDQRIGPETNDEYGRLYAAVNTLLDRIGIAHAALRQAASVFEHANEGIVIADAQGKIVDANAAFTRITLYEKAEVLGKNPSFLKSGHHGAEFYAAMWKAIGETGHWSGEIWNRRKNGEFYPELLTISAVRDKAGGELQGYVAMFYDISSLKAQQRQLERMAHYDALTGLPNRVLLADRMEQAMSRARRQAHHVAALLLDLDGFKAINDSRGHAVGDRLLVALSQRLRVTLRDTDTLARLGGDEFVAVLTDLNAREEAPPLVERLLQAASDPVEIDGEVMQVTASIGLSYYPQGGEVDADQLLRQADQAMYEAKRAGKNRYHLFDAAHDIELRGRHEGIERLRRALNNGELTLFYQPKVNLRSGAVIGCEALMRWHHPERGLLAPGIFLPQVENHEMIVVLGEWTIKTALQQMERWRAKGVNLAVSVNVPGRQLLEPAFVDKLKASLAIYPAVARDLELEVLESSALEDMARVSSIIDACTGLGIAVSIDDFGAGYSSLTYLKRLPVNTLKVDQSFVREMLVTPDDVAILEGIVGLAESFGRDVIAEGVETPAHCEMLLRMGSDLAQGYAIARPMPADALEAWLANWRAEGLYRPFARVKRERFPLLIAAADVGAWAHALKRHLQDDAAPMPHGLLVERITARLNRTHKADLAADVARSRIPSLCAALGRLADELCKLKRTGKAHAALMRVTEIDAGRDAIIEEIHGVLDAVSVNYPTKP